MKKIIVLVISVLSISILQGQQPFTLIDMVKGEKAFYKECEMLGSVSDGFALYTEPNGNRQFTKWGIVDMEQKRISVPATKDYAQIQWVENGHAVVVHREGYDYNFKKVENPDKEEVSYPYVGMIDARTGEIVIPFEYTSISFLQDDIRIATTQDEICVFDKNGKKVFCEKGISPQYKNGFIKYGVVIGKSSWGGKETKDALMNLKGEIIVPHDASFDLGYADFSEGMKRVSKDGKHGYIDIEGNVVIDFQYENVSDFRNGMAEVRKNGQIGFINKKNEIVIPFKTYESLAFQITDYCIKFKENGHWGLMDYEGKTVLETNYTLISTYSHGYAKATDIDGNVFIIDEKGTITTPLGQGLKLGSKSEGLFSFEIDGKHGLMTYNGEEVLPPTYDKIKLKGKGGHWIIKKENKYGLLSPKGDLILEPKYDSIFGQYTEQGDISFVLTKDGLQGIYYLDKVIEPCYKWVGTASDGFFPVRFVQD